MRRTSLIQRSKTAVAIALVLSMQSACLAEDNAVDAFRNWAGFFGGGVWRTKVEGSQHEHRYQKLNGGRFQSAVTIDNNRRAHLIGGVDPNSRRFRLWQFGADGSVTVIEVRQLETDSWMLNGRGAGPNGRSRYRSRVTRTGPDSTREEMLEYQVNGEAQPTSMRIWKRTDD